MARDLGTLLKARGETVAVSESSTGGLASAALLSIPGASAYFIAGAVVYTAAARHGLLALPAELPPGTRSSSEPCAELATPTVRERFGATWGLAETAAAGPAGNRYGDAAGRTCLAASGPVERVLALETGRVDHEASMREFASAALRLLREAVRAAVCPRAPPSPLGPLVGSPRGRTCIPCGSRLSLPRMELPAGGQDGRTSGKEDPKVQG